MAGMSRWSKTATERRQRVLMRLAVRPATWWDQEGRDGKVSCNGRGGNVALTMI